MPGGGSIVFSDELALFQGDNQI